MKTRSSTLLPLALATCLLAGCEGGDSPETTGTPDSETAGGSANESAREPATATTEDKPAAETAREMSAEPAGAAGAGGAKLGIATSGPRAAHLADSEGRALYLLEGDPEGASNCYDACAEAWPPFLAAQGEPTAADSAVQSSLIGSFQREDGSMQVSYNGHALYYYAKDQGTGQATGQDVTDEWGEWYLVTPEGEPLEEHGGE